MSLSKDLSVIEFMSRQLPSLPVTSPSLFRSRSITSTPTPAAWSTISPTCAWWKSPGLATGRLARLDARGNAPHRPRPPSSPAPKSITCGPARLGDHAARFNAELVAPGKKSALYMQLRDHLRRPARRSSSSAARRPWSPSSSPAAAPNACLPSLDATPTRNLLFRVGDGSPLPSVDHRAPTLTTALP